MISMSTTNGVVLKNIVYNGHMVRKWNHNGVEVFSAGAAVVYNVDTTVSYVEEVDNGASCLNPKTFTPTKTGWTFVGWREDKSASSDVLSSKNMGTDPVSLYAVFKQDVTLTWYSKTGTTGSSTKAKYYNNGNTVNPTFTLGQSSIDGWTKRGWGTSTSADASVVYADGTHEFTSDTTVYGLYQQEVTLSYSGNSADSGSVAAQKAKKYYNSSGNTKNAVFTLATNNYNRDGYKWIAWAKGSASGTQYASGASVSLDSNTTFYAVWEQTYTPYYVAFANYPITVTASRGDVKTAETLSSGYRLRTKKNADANEWGQVTASVSLPTQGCNKVAIKYVCSNITEAKINGSTVSANGTLTFDCSGNTFDLTLQVTDNTAYYTAELLINEIYFYRA